MTVQVPFELRRRSAVGSASALFLPTRDASVLLAVCTRLKIDPSGRVFDVAGGFLLKLERPTTHPVSGATRLRELAEDFYLPVDAELVPALLDDEAAGLVRDGGLVFLPGGRILRFDRRGAVDLAKLVTADPRPRRPWAPLPEPRRLADRLAEIAWEVPDVPPEALYREFEQDLRRPGSRAGGSRGETEPNPDEADTEEERDRPHQSGMRDPTAEGPGADVSGEATGGGLMSGLHGLADALKGLAGRAGAGFSAFKEKLQWEWIDHSALVSKLLHEFREGDPSRALRHAFPMAPADSRNRSVGWGNRLPWSRAIYNLRDLLGRPARGQPVGVWRARPDLVEALTREYRKAAEQAIRDGDFRRAAYIYGKLLGDDRLAAQALQRGGLHRDAAILYWKKINDLAAAAQAFEAAGEADKAIELYRQLGRHESAGDLLRRIGEEDAAVAEYEWAARHATSSVPPDHYHAGLILIHKARRTDRAVVAFQAGWDRRPGGNATLCALELALIHADRGAIGPIRVLLDEADALFRSVGSDGDAATFYNTTALLVAGTRDLAPFAEEVRDRALLALAGRLTQDLQIGRPAATGISNLFGEASLWTAAFVRDAQFAAIAAQRRSLSPDRDSSAGRDPRLQGIQVGRGMVTAAAQASATSELFLAFDNGKVVSFRPGRNQIVPVAKGPGAARALAVDAEGQAIVALRQNEYGAMLTCSLRRPDGTFQTGPDGHFPAFLTSWITPVLPWGADWLVGLGDGIDLIIVEAASWMPRSRLSFAHALGEPPATALLLPAGPSCDSSLDPFVVLTHDGPCWVLFDDCGRRRYRTGPTWCPAASGTHPLHSVSLTWTNASTFVGLIGLDQHGALNASDFHMEDGVLENVAWRVATIEGGYVAATRSGVGTVAAVSRTRIDWLRSSPERFQPYRSLSNSSFSSAVACFPAISPQEVLVVFSNGFVARVAPPQRGSTL